MTDHLTECPVIALLIKGNTVAAGSCICARLRACEQRGYSIGYVSGVDDARNEAAIALTSLTVYIEPEYHNHVLAAIEALREE